MVAVVDGDSGGSGAVVTAVVGVSGLRGGCWVDDELPGGSGLRGGCLVDVELPSYSS